MITIFYNGLSSLLFPLEVLYLLVILILILILKSTLFIQTEGSRGFVKNPSIRIRILLAFLSILSISPFFALYFHSINDIPITSMFEALILNISLGGIIYLILDKILEFFSKKNSFTINNIKYTFKGRTKYSFFLLLIILLAMIFTAQTFSEVNYISTQNTPNYNVTAVSPNFTKLAYTFSNKQVYYLEIKDLNDSYSGIYSLCQSVHWCLTSNNEYITRLQFVNENIILISEEYIGSVNRYNQIYYFNLQKKEITDTFIIGNQNQFNQPVRFNSSLYFGNLYYIENGTYFFQLVNLLTRTYHDIFIKVNTPFKTLSYPDINSYSISPDFSKLVIYFNGGIYFFKLLNNQAELVNSILNINDIDFTDYSFGTTFHVINWSNDSSTIFYSFFTEKTDTNANKDYSTGLFEFNYSTTTLKTIFNVSKVLDVTSFNQENSYVISGSAQFKNHDVGIYLIKNNNVTLLQQYPGKLISTDNSLNKLIIVDNSSTKLQLLSYQITKPYLQLEKSLVSSNTENLPLLKIISQIMITGFFLLLITTAGSMVMDNIRRNTQ